MCCFSCNQRIGALHPKYLALMQLYSGDRKRVFEALKLDSVHHLCCRQMLMTQPELYQTLQAQHLAADAIPFTEIVRSSDAVCDYVPN